MPQRGVELVGEFVTGTAASGAFRASALDHEVRNHAVEYEAVVKALSSLGSFGQTDEILDCLGRQVGEQLHLELSFCGVKKSECCVGHSCDCIKPGNSFLLTAEASAAFRSPPKRSE